MYRQYENPRELEQKLQYLKNRKEKIEKEMHEEKEKYQNNQELVNDLEQEISELEQRINFAWQDEEYLENLPRYDY